MHIYDMRLMIQVYEIYIYGIYIYIFIYMLHKSNLNNSVSVLKYFPSF